MIAIRAHELAARAAAAGLSIDDMCARAGVQRATFDQWRSEAIPTPDAVVGSLLRVVEVVEQVRSAPVFPEDRKARRDMIDGFRKVMRWGWPSIGDVLGLNLSQALRVKTLKFDVSDADIDYLRRLADAVQAVPRTRGMTADPPLAAVPVRDEPAGDQEQGEDGDMRELVLDAAVQVYLEADGAGEDAEGARWAIGQVLNRLGLLADARARLAAATGSDRGQPTAAAAGAIGRVPFAAMDQAPAG